MSDSLSQKQSKTTPKLKIGLALSGGGFRASIFHLGVIRRLEELGIMQDVNVMSMRNKANRLEELFVEMVEANEGQPSDG